MNLSWIDWAMMIVAVVALRFVSLSTRSRMKGVADFLSANRSAGRYLLTIASQMGGMGAITFVGMFEMYYQNGFPTVWWALMTIPVGVIIALTGWVFYRFRETRALTMAQFLEMRYSRRFRIFAGFLAWGCGLLNFGIFPAVAARFFIYFCGLPEHFHVPGIEMSISTFATVMIIDLGLALTFVNMGGQVSIMITECVQGIFSSIAFVIISASVLLKLQWPRIVEALSMAPANASMLDSFHTSAAKDFNIWYFMIAMFGAFYGYMSWQGSQGFYSSARSPHEQKMGGIIAIWRDLPKALMALLLPIAAFSVLHLPEFAAKAAVINDAIRHIDSPAIQTQMRVPIALAHFLPIGIKGLLATTMLFFSFTSHDTYMHSWGSIFIQDVVMPIRRRPLDPQQHILWLRCSIVGVAIFAFLFSFFYPQTQKIFFFMAITGTIWLGGSGAVIVGGLYWRKGTTPAAYSALILGALLGVGGLIVPQIYQNRFGREFPINGQWLWLIAMLSASVIYLFVSLLTREKGREYNLERMLSRGKYARSSEPAVKLTRQGSWLQIVGITEEFSLCDRILAIALVVWNSAWFATFCVVTISHLVFPTLIGPAWWAKFWHTYVWTYLIIGVPATVWFTVGGIIDIKGLFRTLAGAVRDHTDDGRVVYEAESGPVSEAESIPAMNSGSHE